MKLDRTFPAAMSTPDAQIMTYHALASRVAGLRKLRSQALSRQTAAKRWSALMENPEEFVVYTPRAVASPTSSSRRSLEDVRADLKAAHEMINAGIAKRDQLRAEREATSAGE